MRAADADVLVVPGWRGSGPGHWQRRWAGRLSTARVVEQDDWERPRLAAWRARLVEAVGAAGRPVVLIAHSLGVPLVAHAAPTLPAGKVAGAFLVAPPAQAAVAIIPEIDAAFAPYPLAPLPFPSVLAFSRTDPYDPGGAAAAALAAAWGAEPSDAGEAGHLNDASGHGPWPEGLMRLAGFLRGLAPPAGTQPPVGT